MANSVDPDQTAPIGEVCSGPTLFASLLNLSAMLGNYLQQTTFSDAFFFGALTPSLPYIMHAICRGKLRLFYVFMVLHIISYKIITTEGIYTNFFLLV